MAEVFVSPGVYTQEMDDTFSPPPGAAAIGAALVGFAKRGPAFLPTTVNSFGQFRDRFGGLNYEFYMFTFLGLPADSCSPTIPSRSIISIIFAALLYPIFNLL